VEQEGGEAPAARRIVGVLAAGGTESHRRGLGRASSSKALLALSSIAGGGVKQRPKF